MRKMPFLVLALLVWVPSTCAHAQQQGAFCKKGDICGVEWDANTEPDMYSYKVYYKPVTDMEYSKVTAHEVLHPTTNVPEVVTTLNMPDGSFNLAVIALDKAGNESEMSEEITMHIDRTPPSRPIIRFIIPGDLMKSKL